MAGLRSVENCRLTSTAASCLRHTWSAGKIPAMPYANYAVSAARAQIADVERIMCTYTGGLREHAGALILRR